MVALATGAPLTESRTSPRISQLAELCAANRSTPIASTQRMRISFRRAAARQSPIAIAIWASPHRLRIEYVHRTILPLLLAAGVAAAADHQLLQKGWAIQSSADVPDSAAAISAAGYAARGWYPATVPSTVFSALV